MTEPTPAHRALSEPLQSFVDGLPCAWLRLDRQGDIVAANFETARLVGHAVEALRGRPFDELLTLPSRVVYQTHLLPLLQFNGDTAELGLSLKSAAGTPPLDVLVYSRRDPQGLIEVILAPIRQRRRIEDELVRVKRAADQAPMMVFQLLCQGAQPLRLPYASQSVRELYGCTPEEAAVSADAVFGRLEPAERQRLFEQLAAGEAGRGSLHLRFQVPVIVGGTPRTHELVATPRRLVQGQTLWHGYVADITDRLRLELDAAERAAAEQSARVRKEFLARASHELRTPLNAILGFAQVLGRDADNVLRPDQRHALDVLQSSGRHMLALVNRLLDLSRVETPGSALQLQPLSLRDEIEAAVQPLRGQAHAAGLQLHGGCGQPDIRVLAEPLALRQLLTNLLSNAIKYNRPGGRVDVGWDTAGPGRVQVWVADTGQGLDARQLQHLFEPFNRLGAERGLTEGSGLGLVLSRQLAQAMGGDIRVDSRPGAGSRFGFDLAQAADEPTPGPAVPAATAPAATASARGVVLYVEDNQVNVLLMQAIATMRPGIELMVATSGAEAEQLCDDPGQPVPELLLLDLNLPDTTGHALLRRLRTRPALAQVPAVLVTAASEESARGAEEPAALGFADCWIKPLDLDATLAALDRFLG